MRICIETGCLQDLEAKVAAMEKETLRAPTPHEQPQALRVAQDKEMLQSSLEVTGASFLLELYPVLYPVIVRYHILGSTWSKPFWHNCRSCWAALSKAQMTKPPGVQGRVCRARYAPGPGQSACRVQSECGYREAHGASSQSRAQTADGATTFQKSQAPSLPRAAFEPETSTIVHRRCGKVRAKLQAW